MVRTGMLLQTSHDDGHAQLRCSVEAVPCVLLSDAWDDPRDRLQAAYIRGICEARVRSNMLTMHQQEVLLQPGQQNLGTNTWHRESYLDNVDFCMSWVVKEEQAEVPASGDRPARRSCTLPTLGARALQDSSTVEARTVDDSCCVGASNSILRVRDAGA